MNTSNGNRVKSKFLAALVAALPIVMLTSPAEAKRPDMKVEGGTLAHIGDVTVKNCAFHYYGFKTRWTIPTTGYHAEALLVRDKCRPPAKSMCQRKYGDNLVVLQGYKAWSSKDEIRHGLKKKDGLHVDATFSCWRVKSVKRK